MQLVRLHKTVGVKVGHVQVGGGAPVVVQSMTMTDTADARGTAQQCIELAEAGSEMVRVTVNVPEAAAAVPEIKQRMLDAGCTAPLIGDFHYNGHLLLTKYPDCARALDKYRINPGNVGTGRRRDEQFSTICKVAVDHAKPVRIGVNGGSLNQELVVAKMQENTDRDLGKSSEDIINECMVLSAIESTALAIESGLRKDQIIISCKTSRPRDLIAVYRALARQTDQPLHLGLTEAGMGTKGLVWSSAAMGVLLNEGIGDTIRVSLTPRPGGDRREEVYAACELLQALGLRSFSPSVTACPGCGRTTSSTFQELAERIQDYIREMMPTWKTTHEGVETMTLAVMGCVVNGPGESKAANIGISLPGHRRGAELSRLHRRPARHDAARHLRRARGGVPAPRRRLRRARRTRRQRRRHAVAPTRRCSRRAPPRLGLLRIPSAPARGDARHPRLARQRRRPADRRRQVALLPGAGGRAGRAGSGLVVVSPLISLMKDQVDGLRVDGVAASYLNSTLLPHERDEVIASVRDGPLPPALRVARAAGRRRRASRCGGCCSRRACGSSPSTRRTASASGATISVRSTASSDGCATTFPACRSTPSPRPPPSASGATSSPSCGCRSRSCWSDRSIGRTWSIACSAAAICTRQLISILERHDGESGIVYCSSRQEVEALAEWLKGEGHSAVPYHAGLSDERPQPQSGDVPRRARRHRRRDGGVRHGHRSVERALRRARRRAAVAGALPAGVGPRRPRRPAGRVRADLLGRRLRPLAADARGQRRVERERARRCCATWSATPPGTRCRHRTLVEYFGAALRARRAAARATGA